jgi:hypothetical protein
MSTEEKLPPPADGVSPELIRKLHENNERFARAKEHIGTAIDAEVNSLTERKQAAKEIKDAEQEIEKTEEQIEKELRKT